MTTTKRTVTNENGTIKEFQTDADLFEDHKNLPIELQKFLEDKGEVCGYSDCIEFIRELNRYGYTCDFGLDGCPIDLQLIK